MVMHFKIDQLYLYLIAINVVHSAIEQQIIHIPLKTKDFSFDSITKARKIAQTSLLHYSDRFSYDELRNSRLAGQPNDSLNTEVRPVLQFSPGLRKTAFRISEFKEDSIVRDERYSNYKTVEEWLIGLIKLR